MYECCCMHCCHMLSRAWSMQTCSRVRFALTTPDEFRYVSRISSSKFGPRPDALAPCDACVRLATRALSGRAYMQTHSFFRELK